MDNFHYVKFIIHWTAGTQCDFIHAVVQVDSIVCCILAVVLCIELNSCYLRLTHYDYQGHFLAYVLAASDILVQRRRKHFIIGQATKWVRPDGTKIDAPNGRKTRPEGPRG